MSRTPFACAYPRSGRPLAAALLGAAIALAVAAPASAHHKNRPHKPKKVRVVQTTTSTVTLRWKKPARARTFAVTKNSKPVARIRTERFSFERLACGKRYRLAVRSLDGAGRRSKAAIRRATTRPCPTDPGPTDPGPSAPPAPTAPSPVQLPSVAGTPHVGNLLAANRGTWNGTSPISYAYGWLRCDGTGADCADIAGASSSSYQLVEADANRTIRVRVTATNSVGQATATSAQTAVVQTLPPPPPGPGTTLTITDQRWICNRPLRDYGPLPITVEHRIANAVSRNLSNGAVRLESSCTGDGNPATTDLILHIHGNGDDQGSSSDGLVLVGAHDIEIEGFVNCGKPGGGAHQDGIQMNRAYRLTFRGFRSGNWDAQTATCHGAGGIFYVSELNDNPANLQDVVCEGCRMVGSTQGPTRAGAALSIYGSTRSGARNSCFSANIPLAGPRSDAVAPVQSGNLFIKRNSTSPQPSPAACTAAP